jgi:hypothetical protein
MALQHWYSIQCILFFFYSPIDSVIFNLSVFLKLEGDGGEEFHFSTSQKRRILNMDETNFSLDGGDGGHGGRPTSSITISGAICPGTSANKSKIASTLMCGSNAAGEALPLHIMFSSKAEDEKKYSINIEWPFGLPRVFAEFGHSSPQSFPASVTINQKMGTDSHVLAQLLQSYVERL